MEKTCRKCGVTKPVDSFHRDKRAAGGRAGECKACVKTRGAAWLERNREHNRQSCAARYAANRERYQAQQKVYSDSHREQIAAQRRAYREANREEIKAKDRAYRCANRDSILEKKRAYSAAHSAEIVAKVAAWQEANRDRYRAWRREWDRSHPEIGRARTARYLKRLRAAAGNLTDDLVAEVLSSTGGACVYCGRTDVDLTVDHVVALNSGGTNHRDNLTAACHLCNCIKGDRGIDFLMRKLAERRVA